jgi:hypothetical protein
MMGATATLASCSEPPQSFTSVAECIKYQIRSLLRE